MKKATSYPLSHIAGDIRAILVLATVRRAGLAYLTVFSILPSSTQGQDDRGVEMTVIVLLYRTNLPHGVKTHPWCIRT